MNGLSISAVLLAPRERRTLSAIANSKEGDTWGSVSYIQYKIAKKWNAGATFTTTEASDFARDGIPDLWTVTPAGVAQAYVVSDLSTTALAKISAKASQNLS